LLSNQAEKVITRLCQRILNDQGITHFVRLWQDCSDGIDYMIMGSPNRFVVPARTNLLLRIAASASVTTILSRHSEWKRGIPVSFCQSYESKTVFTNRRLSLNNYLNTTSPQTAAKDPNRLLQIIASLSIRRVYFFSVLSNMFFSQEDTFLE
jgi:hypothetical protein